MKKLKWVVSVCWMMTASMVTAAVSPEDFVKHIDSYIQYAESNQAAVWPGFHPAATASLIIMLDKDVRTGYGINVKPQSHSWNKINLSTNYPIYFTDNIIGLGVNIDQDDGQFKFIDGQTIFVDKENATELASAENLENKFMQTLAAYFVNNQIGNNASKFAIFNSDYDCFNNKTLLKLIYLEDYALSLAQDTNNPNAEIALRDAVAVHQFRQSLLTPEEREYENLQEILIGTSVFIGWTSHHLSNENYNKMVQRTGIWPLSAVLGASSIASMTYQFPAYLSAVYGHALDKKLSGKQWKNNVFNQSKSISKLAMEYYHFSDQVAQSLAGQAMKKPEYHYDRIERIIESTMSSYLEKMTKAKSEFDNMPGITLQIPIDWGMDMVMAAQMGLAEESYWVNANSWIVEDLHFDTDQDIPWLAETISIKLNHYPYVKSHFVLDPINIDVEKSYGELKLSTKAKINIDGHIYLATNITKLKSYNQNYTSLIITDTNLKISIKHSGFIEVVDGKLKIHDQAAASAIPKNYLRMLHH